MENVVIFGGSETIKGKITKDINVGRNEKPMNDKFACFINVIMFEKPRNFFSVFLDTAHENLTFFTPNNRILDLVKLSSTSKEHKKGT